MSGLILGQMVGGRIGERHLDLYPMATSEVKDALRATEAMYQLVMQQIPQEVDVSQALLIYPEGQDDVVTITEKDMEELQPERFLGNHIVDFYIRFLERGLSPERRKLFYFFNSFFFSKLLQSIAPTRIDPFKVDYEQIRKWTKEVNLFEKDYVFIPIVKSSHWSLVILCNLSSLTCAPDEMTRFPCIVHLDPLEGQHDSSEVEGLMKSYVLEAWMEKFLPSIDIDQFQHQLRALNQLKYIQAEVPQQGNSHNCGLYVLHYIEAFLAESTSLDFSFASSERGPHFPHPHFLAEVSSKRTHIKNLILELSGIFQQRARKFKAIKHLVQELMQTSQKLQAYLEDEGHTEVCVKDMMVASPTIFNGQDCEITHASIHEDSMYAQGLQSSEISRRNNEPLSGCQNGFMEYKNRCERLSLEQQHVKPEVQTIGPTNSNTSIFETKHTSTHEDAIDVQHQQSSGISRLDYEPLDGPELPPAKYQRVTASFSEEHEHLEPKEVPCMDLSEVRKGQNKRGRNMTKEETWELLLCKLEGGHFCKGSGGATHWNLISEAIGKKLGSLPSADQCRLRYDTLLKAYKTYKKYCMKTGKTFSTITKAERLDLKLATTLSEEWYTTMDEICNKANISQKHMKLSSKVCNDLHPLSSPNSSAPDPPPMSQGLSFEDEAATLDSVRGTVEAALFKVIPTSVLSYFNEDLHSTLLNLVQECSWMDWHLDVENGKVFELETVCRRLAILEDCEPREILKHVFKLWKLDVVNVVDMVSDVVNVVDMVSEEGKDFRHIHLWADEIWYLKLGVYEMISQEVLWKNPHLKAYCKSFPIEQSSLQYIRVLRLDGIGQLKRLDLREFLSLRSLAIRRCSYLNSVTGWEFATGLGSLDISWCSDYLDFPDVQYLSSLREFSLRGWSSNSSVVTWKLSRLSQCTKLRRLEIKSWYVEGSSGIVDLENLKVLKVLKFLEALSLVWYSFSSIRGLSGLQALTRLDLRSWWGLRSVPELGCLKGLTYLDLSFSSVGDVEGVGELHLLTWLDLQGCNSLERLPFLGHLKALVYLDVRGTLVKEIPGKDLISLKTLRWNMK